MRECERSGNPDHAETNGESVRYSKARCPRASPASAEGDSRTRLVVPFLAHPRSDTRAGTPSLPGAISVFPGGQPPAKLRPRQGRSVDERGARRRPRERPLVVYDSILVLPINLRRPEIRLSRTIAMGDAASNQLPVTVEKQIADDDRPQMKPAVLARFELLINRFAAGK